jgi:hypothetical protein
MPAELFISDSSHSQGISESLTAVHLEGSECCLVQVDNPLRVKRPCVNPQERVGYSGEAHDDIHPQDISQSSWQTCKAI